MLPQVYLRRRSGPTIYDKFYVKPPHAENAKKLWWFNSTNVIVNKRSVYADPHFLKGSSGPELKDADQK